MPRSKISHVLSGGLLAVSLVLASPVLALSGTAEAFISFTTSGSANPYLFYNISSSHSTTFTNYNALEALAPVTHVGQLNQGGSQYSSCTSGGSVNSVTVSCSASSGLVACPGAQGVWRSVTRTTADVPPLGQFFTNSSGPLTANCPPVGGGGGGGPGCVIGVPSDVDRIISLDTGLPLDISAAESLPSVRLARRAEDSHGEFMLTEWAVVEPTSRGFLQVANASSETYGQHLRGEPRPMFDALVEARRSPTKARGVARVEAPAGRYLVIQGTGHQYKLPLPIIKLRAAAVDAVPSRGARQRVALRASFDHHGHLLGAEAIDGDDRLARSLAETLQLQFVSGAEHRASVFAIFEVGDGAALELLTAQPFFPRCCCGEQFCV
ncbi:MAG: hypothetical protein AAGE94_11260 [Acidobacteriota bacterium]